MNLPTFQVLLVEDGPWMPNVLVGLLEAAVRAGLAQAVRRLPHTCAGASAIRGMRRLVPLLRELGRQGFEGQLTNATQLGQQVCEGFERIHQFLDTYLADHSNLAGENRP